MLVDPTKLRNRLEPLFRENFERFGELGAAVSVWHQGRSVLELRGGFRDAKREQPWNSDTIVLIWSATKGLGSACLLHALQEKGISLDQRVADAWPEFGQAGKAEITLAQLLSHQAGLVALDRKVDILDYPAVIAALEQQRPLWPPGSAHGYHARTFGFLLDELVRRLSGTTLSDYWRAVFAKPLDLNIWIGLPLDENGRVATMYAARGSNSPEPVNFYRDLTRPGTLVHKTFASPAGLQAVSAMNSPQNRAAQIVSFGGIGDATSLAKFYSILASDDSAVSRQFFDPATLGQMKERLVSGLDRVFQIPTSFSAGFMKDPPDRLRKIFGPDGASFGHPGAGGCHAFADPENRLGFAYVMNQMEQSILPNEKSLRLVEAIYG